jgi:hypothetical protein
MFSKAGVAELHGAMHERLDLLLRHLATAPDSLQQREAIPGFGHSSIWRQLVHTLTCEEVVGNQNRARHKGFVLSAGSCRIDSEPEGNVRIASKPSALLCTVKSRSQVAHLSPHRRYRYKERLPCSNRHLPHRLYFPPIPYPL